MQEGQLAQYQSADAYPNIALIQVPISDKIFRTKLSRALQDLQKQRGVLDAQDLLLRWLAFIWGVGRTGNPLLDGQGIPSAAMLEVIFGAVGFDSPLDWKVDQVAPRRFGRRRNGGTNITNATTRRRPAASIVTMMSFCRPNTRRRSRCNEALKANER